MTRAATAKISNPAHRADVLCPYDLSALHSLIQYIVPLQQLDQAAIEILVCDHFDIYELSELPRDRLRDAVSFIYDLRTDVVRD